MALVPVIQPPIMRGLTTKKERMIRMDALRTVSKKEKIVFPIAVTAFVALLVPSAAPLVGSLMLGNLFRECGVVDRLSKTAQNELMNIVVIFLGVSVGATAKAESFLSPMTLGILAMPAAAYAGAGCRRLLCDRGCHKSVFHAMALCRLEPHYLFCDRPGKPPFADTAAGFSADKLENRLIETGAHAVILTSPTYAGVRRDIAAAAEIAHRHGALLLVDEAHGAHFPFCPGCAGAVSCGADLAGCSLHKTLPALGGAALLTARKIKR